MEQLSTKGTAKVASNYEVRKFEGGATRDQDITKPDYEGFLSPLVIERYGQYMGKHRVQPDGTLRASDNWQLGIPLDAYMKSAFRHFINWWKQHRGHKSDENIEESLCALLFNTSGYLHELLKRRRSPEQPEQKDAGELVWSPISWSEDSERSPLRQGDGDCGAQDAEIRDAATSLLRDFKAACDSYGQR